MLTFIHNFIWSLITTSLLSLLTNGMGPQFSISSYLMQVFVFNDIKAFVNIITITIGHNVGYIWVSISLSLCDQIRRRFTYKFNVIWLRKECVVQHLSNMKLPCCFYQTNNSVLSVRLFQNAKLFLVNPFFMGLS